MDNISVLDGKCSIIRKVAEAEIEKSPFFRLIHNSVKDSDGETRKVCTRTYQLKQTTCVVKFFYDYRNDKAQMFFDIVGEKALSHIVRGDFDPEKIEEYILRKNEVVHVYK